MDGTKKLSQNPWVKWGLVLIGIKLSLVSIGLITTTLLGQHFYPDNPGWLAVWYRLDVKEYLTVALNGYEPGTSNAYLSVRLPVVPLLIRGIACLGFQNLFVAAFVMATLVSFPLPGLMEKLASLDYPQPMTQRATWLFLIFPMSFCLHLPLSEGIFMALVLQAFLSARNDDWLTAGFAAALAGATRINGLLLFPALVVEMGHRYYKERKISPQWAWIGLAPLGTLSYLLLNHFVFRNAFEFMVAEKDFYHQSIAWPWTGVLSLFKHAITKPLDDRLLYYYPECITVILLVVVTVWTCWKCRPSYSVWTLLNVGLFTSAHFILSLPRYAIAIFPMYFFMADMTRVRLVYVVATGLSLSLFLYFALLFANGWWAF